MRPPAKINPWLTARKMLNWLENAPDEDSYKRRHAIWLTHTDKLHARKVAEILGVSSQAVWSWISQYNKFGPQGLERTGRGGRRWAFLSLKEESQLLKPFIKKAQSGKPPEAAQIKQKIEKKLGKTVSMSYVYRLLQRHQWADKIAQSGPNAANQKRVNDYLKMARPWLRDG